MFVCEQLRIEYNRKRLMYIYHKEALIGVEVTSLLPEALWKKYNPCATFGEKNSKSVGWKGFAFKNFKGEF